MKWITMLLVALLPAHLAAYPMDGQDYTGIRRLQQDPSRLVKGARLPMSAIAPSGIDASTLPARDPAQSAALREMLGDEAADYGVALLDISDPQRPVYAAHQGELLANVGSVGKVLVMLAWFQRLADLYPQDIAARERVLRDTIVIADDYIGSDQHKVPIRDAASGVIESRPLRIGDSGNLWEYLDWMMSASSNAAASMAMKQLVLAQKLGLDYPPSPAEGDALLKGLSPGVRGGLLLDAMLPPLRRAGFDLNFMRQGSLFTGTGKARVTGTSSQANPRDLLRLMALIEANRLVDPWSSREAKRLMYMTQRRIRYASHPVLNEAAVYFKSGSFYSCVPEPEFRCRKYMGNKVNRLASIALVEYPAVNPQLRYMVAVMSNVLRKNSAVAHQTLALRIHRMVEQRHRAGLDRQGLIIGDDKLPTATLEAAEGTQRD